MLHAMYRLEVYEVYTDSAVLSCVAYSTDIHQILNYKKYCIAEEAEGFYRFSPIQEIEPSPVLEAEVKAWRGLLVISERHSGDLRFLRDVENFNIDTPIWYKNNVEENSPSADLTQSLPSQESTMSAKSTNQSAENAAESAAQSAQAAAAQATQAAQSAQAAQAAAQTLPPVIYAGEAQPTVMDRVKTAATSPAAKTAGGILLSVIAGFLGGVAYQEAQKRGYLNNRDGQA